MLVTCAQCKKPVFVSSSAVADGEAQVPCNACQAALIVAPTGAVRLAAASTEPAAESAVAAPLPPVGLAPAPLQVPPPPSFSAQPPAAVPLPPVTHIAVPLAVPLAAPRPMPVPLPAAPVLSTETPVMAESMFEPLPVEAPVMAEPMFEPLPVEAPVMAEPMFEPLPVEAPVMVERAFESPPVEAPVMVEPAFESPPVEAPVMVEPAFESPPVEAPVMAESAFELPPVEAPVMAESMFELPPVEMPVMPAPTFVSSPAAVPAFPQPAFVSTLPEVATPPLYGASISQDAAVPDDNAYSGAVLMETAPQDAAVEDSGYAASFDDDLDESVTGRHRRWAVPAIIGLVLATGGGLWAAGLIPGVPTPRDAALDESAVAWVPSAVPVEPAAPAEAVAEPSPPHENVAAAQEEDATAREPESQTEDAKAEDDRARTGARRRESVRGRGGRAVRSPRVIAPARPGKSQRAQVTAARTQAPPPPPAPVVPTSPRGTSSAAAEQHYEQGNLLLREKKVALAIEELRKALAINPRHGLAYRSLGVSYMLLGREKSAVEAYERFVQYAAGHKDAAKVREIIAGYYERHPR